MLLHVTLDIDAGTLHVTGEGLPSVALVRAPGTPPDVHVPIGTRAADLLTLTVDGRPARILPAKGRISRRSYRVDAEVGGANYRLVPCSYVTSRLLRDGRALGELDSTGDGSVSADWRDDAKVLGQDIAVGTALAAAFGTGAAPWWESALDLGIEMIT